MEYVSDLTSYVVNLELFVSLVIIAMGAFHSVAARMGDIIIQAQGCAFLIGALFDKYYTCEDST
jgi:hypothetical protein